MHIGIIATPGCWDSGVVTMLDVLRGANTARFQVDRDLPPIEISTVGAESAPVRTAGGMLLPVDRTFDDLDGLDLLVVTALTMNTPGGIVDALLREEVRATRNAVRDWARAGHAVAAACTGTFVLADAGVLDGRQATTTWWLVDEFRRRFPRVTLDMSRMVVNDDSITTAGAAFAHIDLAMQIVASISPQLADATATLLLFDERPARSAGAAQTFLASTDALVTDFEAWVRSNLERAISISEAAHAIGTTRRTLERRVAERLGVTPYALVQRLRMGRANHLQQTTALTLDQIAPMVGYSSAAALRKPLRASRRCASR